MSVLRNYTLDIIRGIAIIIMLYANIYSYINPFEDCPPFVRLIFSSAAPIFIFLSGVSLRLARENGKTKKRLFQRALQILILGVMLDFFIWNIAPFYTMDVLYLISFSLFVLIAIEDISDKLKLIFSIGIILFVFISGNYYEFYLKEVLITDFQSDYVFLDSVRHILIDGWFPIIPWMGFLFLGYLSYKYKYFFDRYSKVSLIIGIGLVFFVTFFHLFLFFKINPIRDGYTEIFYPVTLPFLLYVIGIFLIISYYFNIQIYRFKLLRDIGTFSLPVYVIHSVLIKFYIPFFSQTINDFSNIKYIVGILIFYALVVICVYLIKTYSQLFNSKIFKIIKYFIGL